MKQEYKLEKWVWTEADFEVMGWHDCRIHATAFFPEDFELAFDIDYILKWIHPQPDETYFSFWVAPATIVFKNVHDVEIEIDSYIGNLEIDNINRDDESSPPNAAFITETSEWLWTIECQEGEIRFRSVGYEQFIRMAPDFTQSQTLDRKVIGISFARDRIG
jgi:hypothetical protein